MKNYPNLPKLFIPLQKNNHEALPQKRVSYVRRRRKEKRNKKTALFHYVKHLFYYIIQKIKHFKDKKLVMNTNCTFFLKKFFK